MNLCGKFLCLAAIGSICVLLRMGIDQESSYYIKTDCGNREERMLPLPFPFRRKRFIGGSPANISVWPWVVSLQHRTNNSSPFNQRCSGAIIRKQWILTATSCFHEDPYKNVSHWRVVVGSSDLNYDDNHTQIASIENVIFHQYYHPDSSNNDIALVKLTVPLVFNDYVHHVCIPDLMNVEQHKYGACHIAGYDHSIDHGVFKESAVELFSHSKCNMLTWWKFKVAADMFCAGFFRGGVDGCETNTGGPLSCYVPTTARYYVRGIRIITTKCGVIRRPNIYLQVSKFYYWIERNIEREH